jgi:cytoskeletal protein CcmA (bactofilin family)
MAKEQINTGMAHNMLSAGTKVIGTITTTTDIRIDCEIDGDLECEGKVIIGTLGHLKGTIICANADIMGTIDGKMEVTDTLTLKSTAKVYGDIKTKTLSIEPKAIFTGTCVMGDAQPQQNDKKQNP